MNKNPSLNFTRVMIALLLITGAAWLYAALTEKAGFTCPSGNYEQMLVSYPKSEWVEAAGNIDRYCL